MIRLLCQLIVTNDGEDNGEKPADAADCHDNPEDFFVRLQFTFIHDVLANRCKISDDHHLQVSFHSHFHNENRQQRSRRKFRVTTKQLTCHVSDSDPRETSSMMIDTWASICPIMRNALERLWMDCFFSY